MPPRKDKPPIEPIGFTPSSLSANSTATGEHHDCETPAQGSNTEYMRPGHELILPVSSSSSSSKLLQVQSAKLPYEGKKRGRKPKASLPDDRPSKRAKISGVASGSNGAANITPPAEHALIQEKDIRNPATGRYSTSKLKEHLARWSFVPLATPIFPQNLVERTLKPRLWAADRKEFLATFPDMNGPKCCNNVSWEPYAIPLVLLDDEQRNAFEVQRSNMDAYTMDLVTLRSFVCSIPVLQETHAPSMDSIIPQHVTHVPEKIDPPLKTRKARQYPAPQKTQDLNPLVKIDPTAPLHILEDALYTILPDPDVAVKAPDHPMPSNRVISQDDRIPISEQTEFWQLDSSDSDGPNTKIPPLGRDLRTCPLNQLPEALGEAKAVFEYRMASEHPGYVTEGVQKTTVDSLLPETFKSLEALSVQEAHPDAMALDLPSNLVFAAGCIATASTAVISQEQSSDERSPATTLSVVEANGHSSPLPLNEPTPLFNKRHLESQTLQGTYIPSSLPKEVQTIIEAYIAGQPVTIVVSRDQLLKHWSLEVPTSYGYIIMGFFRIIGVQEARVVPSVGRHGVVADTVMSGEVEWRFRLRWAPGGEEYLFPNITPSVLEHPWWCPPAPDVNAAHETTMRVTPNIVSQGYECIFPKEPEDYFNTTPQYRAARIAHHEYKFRHNHLKEVYESILPTTLLAPYGPLVLDNLFPRGWFCLHCGKINFQAALRHRKCSNQECRDKPLPVMPYAIPLLNMRDPQDRLPLSMPYNSYPKHLRIKKGTFNDGMKVVSYYSSHEELAFVKHVFTGNHPPRQAFATDLLARIQSEVELVRPFDDSSPYFAYSAASPRGHVQPTDTEWPEMQPAVNEAKRQIVRRARCYAEVPDNQLSVNRLKVLAWVTAGIRKGNDIFRTKDKVITILSLGCDVEITLIPRGDWPTVKNSNDVGSSAINALKADAPFQGAETPVKSVKKADRPTFNLTLVHGDIIVLYGEDFEYSIKRDRTSILMIASHED